MAKLGKKIELNCNGCTLCCKGGVRLLPELGDDVDKFRTRKDSKGNVLTAVDKDGMCIYTCKKGCSLYDTKRPVKCEAVDCREWLDDPMMLQHLTDEIIAVASTVTERTEE